MTGEEPSLMYVQNPYRSNEKVRSLSEEDLGIPGGGKQADQNDWDTLYELSYQAASESEVGVAVRTIDGNIAKGIDLRHGRSAEVHALELAIWKGFSENYTPVVQIAIYSDKDKYQPCNRCEQVLLDYSANPEIQAKLGKDEDWSELKILDEASHDSDLETGADEDKEPRVEGKDLENVEDSEDKADSPFVPDDEDDKLQIEYVRFDQPVYHLRYKQLNRTFCGRKLLDGEYQSGDREPDLLDPCRSCHGEGPKTNEQKKEELRAELHDFISGVKIPDNGPGQFQTDEIVTIIESLEEESLNANYTEENLRFRLSRMLSGINHNLEEPLSFTKPELEALVQASRGDRLVPSENHLFTWTEDGLIKRVPLASFRSQRRGGKGNYGLNSGKDSPAKNFFVASPRDVILIFTNLGKVYRVDAYDIPCKETDGTGEPLSSLINLEDDESAEAAVTLRKLDDYDYIAFLSSTGRVKRTKTERFEHILSTGIIAIELGDSNLVDVVLADNGMDFLIGTHGGNVIRFEDSDVNEVKRRTQGVHGIKLKQGDSASALSVFNPDQEKYVLTATKHGYGKKTSIDEYRPQMRNGTGLVDISTTNRNGPVVDILCTSDNNELLILSKFGRVLRTSVDEVSEMHRNTKGVLLMGLEEGDSIVAIDIVD